MIPTQREAATLELRQLQFLVTVVDTGSFTRAALELGIAQPALSRQVKKLEEELGVMLLYRHGRGVSATLAGVSFVANARAILGQVDVAVKAVSVLKEDRAGTATVGMPPSVGRILSVPLARHFRENFPNVGLRIIEAYSGTVVEWLRSGRVDAALIYSGIGVGSSDAEALVQEELVLVGRPTEKPPLRDKAVRFADLDKIKLVLPSRSHALRVRLDEVCRREGVELHVELEIDALHSMLECAHDGLAYTIIQPSAVRDEIARGMLSAWPISHPEITLTLYLATGTQRSTSFSIRRLASVIRQQVLALQSKAGWQRPEARK